MNAPEMTEHQTTYTITTTDPEEARQMMEVAAYRSVLWSLLVELRNDIRYAGGKKNTEKWQDYLYGLLSDERINLE